MCRGQWSGKRHSRQNSGTASAGRFQAQLLMNVLFKDSLRASVSASTAFHVGPKNCCLGGVGQCEGVFNWERGPEWEGWDRVVGCFRVAWCSCYFEI
ncbi:hypothetical protein BaRGS_00023667 [Batillaria attramentaria]|uniref:Uncharacterized protein n=1 Tax=Batillaria attramentaria TaxID=370345 RepID=A0ABD0KDK8_9CAEN